MLYSAWAFSKRTDKLEFARRAGSQVVRKICVVVLRLAHSVSFYCARVDAVRDKGSLV